MRRYSCVFDVSAPNAARPYMASAYTLRVQSPCMRSRQGYVSWCLSLSAPKQADAKAPVCAYAPLHRVMCLALFAAVLAACGTTPAPNFRGRWQAVNAMDAVPRELPLHQAYIYSASPMDRTLKGMLTRWARDSRMTLSYLHGSDFTLHQPVAAINSQSLQQAIAGLNAAYAAQHIVIDADKGQITVRAAADSAITSGAP